VNFVRLGLGPGDVPPKLPLLWGIQPPPLPPVRGPVDLPEFIAHKTRRSVHPFMQDSQLTDRHTDHATCVTVWPRLPGGLTTVNPCCGGTW